MAQSFSNQFKKMEQRIRNEYKESLSSVNVKTKKYLVEHIDTHMYRAYKPILYVRTGNFRKSITGRLETDQRQMTSVVYFDEQYLDHMRDGQRVYVPYLIQTNEPKRNPARWIGNARRDTSFYEETTLQMMNSYRNEVSDLRKRNLIY